MLDRIVLNVRFSDELALDQLDKLVDMMDIGYVMVSHCDSERCSLIDTKYPVLDKFTMTISCEIEDSFVVSDLSHIEDVEDLTLSELNDTDNLIFEVMAAFHENAHPGWHFGHGQIFLTGIPESRPLRTDDVEFEFSTAERILKVLSSGWLVKLPELYDVIELSGSSLREVHYFNKDLSINEAILSCINKRDNPCIVKVFDHDRESLLAELR